jgi:hypothetical protein
MGVLKHYGHTPDDHLETTLLSSVDRTDALLGALLGLLRYQGKTRPVGNALEGSIHVATPDQELITLARRLIVTSPEIGVQSPRGGTSQSHQERPRRKPLVAPEGVTGYLLRLGKDGLGRLSQQQTIERALGLWEGEGQAVIPLGIGRIAADTIQRSRGEGLTVLVGYGGRLILQLDRACIEGKGREQPTSGVQMFNNDPNPWSDIDKANYWLLSDSARELNNESYDMIETWRKKRNDWVRGVPRGRTAWLRYRRLAE